jgi:hypothetical protein
MTGSIFYTDKIPEKADPFGFGLRRVTGSQMGGVDISAVD